MKTLQIGRTLSALLLAAALVSGCDISNPEPQIIDSIDVISGDGQSATAGTTLPDPLVVQVSGPAGIPVVGAHIAWSVTSGGGTVSSSVTTTGSDGRTQVTWKLGTATGIGTVRAVIQETGVQGYEASFASVAL